MAVKFKIKPNKIGLYIEHTHPPQCVIQVYELESQEVWQGDFDSIFDFFSYNKDGKTTIYQILIDEYIDVTSADDVTDEYLPAYKATINKCWKWLLYGYLIPGKPLPSLPDYIEVDTAEYSAESLYSIEVDSDSGKRYVFYRGSPIFRAELKAAPDALGSIGELEFLESETPIDVMQVAHLLRDLGDWLVKNNV